MIGSAAYKDSFSAYHPLVNMMYFAAVLSFSMLFMHPLCLLVSLACAICYALRLNGAKALKFLLLLLPMLIIAALVNPLFNHQGATILAYFSNGNPLTLESIYYGLAAAGLLGAVIMWFSCFNAIITTDKLVYLLGRIIPALSLVLSMSLRMLPRFKAQLKIIVTAQKCLGRDIGQGSILHRARQGLRILSIMITWALENAVDTADAMTSRGYGLPGRTAFALYRWQRRDTRALACILSATAYIIIGALNGGLHFRYFPLLQDNWGGVYTASLFICYLALALLPLIIDIQEELAWKAIASNS